MTVLSTSGCTRPRRRHLNHTLGDADRHHNEPERDANIRSIRLPRPPLRELEEAERWENVRQRACGGCADEFEHNPQVRRDQSHAHGRYDEGRCEDDVAIRLVRLAREVVFGHDFATDEAFEGKGGDHVEAEAPVSPSAG